MRSVVAGEYRVRRGDSDEPVLPIFFVLGFAVLVTLSVRALGLPLDAGFLGL
jgi:hypothetical protein